MSLSTIKTVVYLTVIALAIAIDYIGGPFGWAVATILLGGTIPAFRLICRASADDTLTAVEQRRSRQEMTANDPKDSGSSGIPFATPQ